MNSQKFTDLLIEHHHEMQNLLEQATKQYKVVSQVKLHFDLHCKLRDELLPGNLKRKKIIKPVLLDLQNDQLAINTLFWDINEFTPGRTLWKEKLKLLTENFIHFSRKEEQELFIKINNQLSDEQLIELGRQFSELRNKELADERSSHIKVK